MTIYAFKDDADGYYQVEVADGEQMPAWVANLTPCAVQQPVDQNQVPQVIDALQGLLALDHEGLSGFYETWSTAPERTFAQRAFINKALTWKRNDPTLNAAATDLGLTSDQVDQLFILAASL